MLKRIKFQILVEVIHPNKILKRQEHETLEI